MSHSPEASVPQIKRKNLHSIISERQKRYTETVLAMGGATEEESVKPVVVAVSQAVCKQNEKFVIKRLRVKMANCFDFRNRTTSFDLHHIGHGTKMSLLSKLFRSKSDSNVKSPKESPRASPKTSPKSSPGAPNKRRFMRVVRDDQAKGEEYVNPHVIRRYNPGFWEKQYMLKKSHSVDDSVNNSPLPYTVSGHTILKKHSSLDECAQSQSAGNSPTGEKKHATFSEVVEVVEYHPKTKCKLILEDCCIVNEKLHDEWEECLDVEYQVPREENDDISEEESCKAIMDIVLDQVSRSVPLEGIKEGDENEAIGCSGTDSKNKSEASAVAMEEDKENEISESDILSAKRSKLEDSSSPISSNEP